MAGQHKNVHTRDLPFEALKDVLPDEWTGLMDLCREVDGDLVLKLVALGALVARGDAEIAHVQRKSPVGYAPPLVTEAEARRPQEADGAETLDRDWGAPLQLLERLKSKMRPGSWVDSHAFELPDDGPLKRRDLETLVALGVLWEWGEADFKIHRDEDYIIRRVRARVAE